MAEIANKLNVIANNKIIVPGCEPASAISSTTLAAGLNCNQPLVSLSDALKAIPGSYVEFGYNSGFGRRLKWFVFPPREVECPCSLSVDYYQILRDIAVEEDVVEEVDCNTIDLGFCQISDDGDTYGYSTPGGTAFGQVGGILRWPPVWNNV
jgi:hypothetical protein